MDLRNIHPEAKIGKNVKIPVVNRTIKIIADGFVIEISLIVASTLSSSL